MLRFIVKIGFITQKGWDLFIELLEPPYSEEKYLEIVGDQLLISVYDAYLIKYKNVMTHSGKKLKCLMNEKLQQPYEIEIYENGNLPTRENNWHDYFNFCVWVNFPKTKAMINFIQYCEIKNKKKKNRTPMENAMTLFDENGLIVLSTDPELLDLIRRHEWKKLFWEKRHEVLKHLSIVIIGHSMCEKFLNPYVGMTGHAMLCEVEELNLSKDCLDLKISELLESGMYQSPRDFQPIPVLGFPGWYKGNSEAGFYDDSEYFRGVRRSVDSPSVTL